MYVRMPGTPKKERKRQDGENKKPPQGKLSKKGTVIRCRVCKGIGHNRTTCSRRTGSGNASAGASQSAKGNGGASQSTRDSGGASQSARGSVGASQSIRGSDGASRSVRGSVGASQSGRGTTSKRKSCPSSTTASSRRHCSQLSVDCNVSLTAYSMWSSLIVIYFLCFSYILCLVGWAKSYEVISKSEDNTEGRGSG